MILKENSSLNRYEWTSKKIDEITENYIKYKNVTLYDIGARDNILKRYIKSPDVNYKAFDLVPLDATAETWNIEQPFPYAHPAPQIVTMLEIVEHLNNPWICFKNVSDIIDTGGYLILTTPNPAWSDSRLNLLQTGYLSCFSRSDLELNHHVFTAWPHIVNKLLKDSKFEIIEYSTLDGPTKIFDKNLKGLSVPLKLASRLIKKSIEMNDKASCGMSYGIIAKKID